MIDIFTLEKLKGETKEDFIRRVIIIVDDNWMEVKSIKVGETPLQHFYRFQEYEKTPEFISYIVGERPGDTPATRTARSMEVRATQDLLKCNHTDYVFENLSVKRSEESFLEHYNRFIEIEETDIITDIVERRPNESKATFNMRFNLYADTKNKIIKLAEDELLNELTRIKKDDKKETLEKWKERVDDHIKSNVNFISNSRRITKENMRKETHLETGERVKFYQQHVIDIERLIMTEDVEKQKNDVAWKESQKLKARKEAEEEAAEEADKKYKDKKKEIVNKAKNNLLIGSFFGSSFIGFFLIVENYGWNEAFALFTIIITTLFMCYKFKKEDTIKVFKVVANVVFWFFRILNEILNAVGMSVTNNRRF